LKRIVLKVTLLKYKPKIYFGKSSLVLGSSNTHS
jgi:hypothetical protein